VLFLLPSSMHHHSLPPPEEKQVDNSSATEIRGNSFSLTDQIYFKSTINYCQSKQTFRNFLFISSTTKTLIIMDELRLLSKCNFVVVGNNSPSKLSQRWGSIVNPNHQNGILCQFFLGGRKVVSPQRILREKIIDTVNKQRVCNKTCHP
jgi:hypothetical protein